MLVYHIYKGDCYRSSRIMLQSEWDLNSRFIHRGINKKCFNKNQDSQLKLLKILREVFTKQKNNKINLVFHAQSALIYLLVVYLVSKLANVPNIFFIYDIHDYHEKSKYDSIWSGIRYGWFRYNLLYIFEKLVFNIGSIKKITVSKGLAKLLYNRYKTSFPIVIYSAPKPRMNPTELATQERYSKAIVYLGTSNHEPNSLYNSLKKSNLSIHLYGKGFSSILVENHITKNNYLQVFGEFNPTNIEFLAKYQYLVLYKPEVVNMNYKVALPNKLFQGLSFGLSFIVSENFEEMISLLSEIKGALYVLKDSDSIEKAVDDLSKLRDEYFFQRISELSERLHYQSKMNYYKVTFNA